MKSLTQTGAKTGLTTSATLVTCVSPPEAPSSGGGLRITPRKRGQVPWWFGRRFYRLDGL